MKVYLIVFALVITYLRRPLKLLYENWQLSLLIELYDSFFKAENNEEKLIAYHKIARRKSLSNELISGGAYFVSLSPSYQDFHNIDKIKSAYFTLIETLDSNVHWMRKYLNPKYLIKDLFFLPAALFGFLIRHQFNTVPSFLLSGLGWIATALMSAYAAELRFFIDSLIQKAIALL